MKYYIFMSLLISSLANAMEQTEAPYTLVGGPEKCSLTVHDYGYENNKVEDFFAEVSVSALPGVVFHLKLTERNHFVGMDGNTRHKLIVTGAMPWSITPLARGVYRLLQGKNIKSYCGKLSLGN